MTNPRRGGVLLETQFAVWMESHLKYDKTVLRMPVTGKISDRSYDVDIYGERYRHIWKVLERLSYPAIAISILTLAWPNEMLPVRLIMESLVSRLDQSLAGSAVLIVAIVALVLARVGKQKSRTYAWVECKDLKSKVKRAQVQKLISSVKDVQDSDDAKWTPDVVMMVSGNDFDPDALNFAREYGIICFRRIGTSFEQV